uniref:G_PROTEIN_RECEP_F1_2 domain-containing protein n=1 Tax=Panagrellus redivivus TaxID=6233 RepID=A0A7E4V173_PANRE
MALAPMKMNFSDAASSLTTAMIQASTSMPLLSAPSGPAVAMNATLPASSSSVYTLRLALTIIHLLLVSIGSINLLVIFIIIVRPYMRSITNVYMISLCMADFLYLINLTLVAATQLNNKSWPFGSFMCTTYHGTESTGKYASVIFVVLLAVDRYCAMCKSDWCSRYRNYRWAIGISCVAWVLAILAATPLYAFSEVVKLRYRTFGIVQKLCIIKWPSSESAKWYITFSSVLIFAIPLVIIVFCYYHILNKLREALKGSKRLRRTSSSRAPYHRVTRLVLWVVVFHVICWSPFWLFNVFSSVFGLRVITPLDRIVVNFLHLLPYFNCALNPLLYAAHAENFRAAIKSLFFRRAVRSPTEVEESRVFGNTAIKPMGKHIGAYAKLSSQSDRLMNNSLFHSTTTSEFSTATRFTRVVSPNSIGIYNSTSALSLAPSPLPLDDADNSRPRHRAHTLLPTLVTRWNAYRHHSNEHLIVPPSENGIQSINGFAGKAPLLKQHSAGAGLIVIEKTPMQALTSLNNVSLDGTVPTSPRTPTPTPTIEVPSGSMDVDDGDVFI